MPDWFFWSGGAIIGLLGLMLAAWALIGDRSRGRRRCPKCWYDMSATIGLRCPECGREAKREKKLFKPRRRWRLVFVSVIPLLAAGFFAAQPQAHRKGWASLLPRSVLILSLNVRGWDWAFDETERRFEAKWLAGPGSDEPNRRMLYDWQWRMFAESCVDVMTSDRPTLTRVNAIWSLSSIATLFPPQDVRSYYERIARLLDDPDPQVRAGAALYGVNLGEPTAAIARLLPLLDDRNQQVREFAVLGLRLLSHRSAQTAPALLKALNDKSWIVRKQAIGALGVLGERGSAEPTLLDAVAAGVADSDARVRRSCPWAVRRFTAHEPRAWQIFESMLRSDDEDVRSGALEAISDSTDAPANCLSALIDALTDPSPVIRTAAAESLSFMDTEQLRPFMDRLKAVPMTDPGVSTAVGRQLRAADAIAITDP